MFWLVVAFCDVKTSECVVPQEPVPFELFDTCAKVAEELDKDARYHALLEELAPVEGRTYCLTAEEMRELNIKIPGADK